MVWKSSTCFLCFLILACYSAPLERLELKKWEFMIPDKFDNEWRSANVPSNIHLDLMTHNLIKDPFKGTNAENLTWIENATVIYRTNFTISGQLDQIAFRQLIFDGIDSQAGIYLNGQNILNATSAFVQYTIDVRNHLQKDNVLQVRFDPTFIKKELVEANYTSSLLYSFAFHRKPAYQYGWTSTPRMVTKGIYKHVYLLNYNMVRFDYVWVRTISITSLNGTNKNNNVTAVISVATAIKGNFTKVMGNLTVATKINGVWYQRLAKFSDQPIVFQNITIHNARLWWPKGTGEPYQYDLQFELRAFDFTVDQKKMKFGIRHTTIRDPTVSVSTRINQYAIYIRGASYIPADMLYPRLTNPAFKKAYSLQNLMNDIQQSNINALKIWGGGLYETDQFYEQCSKRGIMVFHDIMFSYGPYPDYKTFLLRIEDEVKYQVRRLRNYPCLTAWIGNDQVNLLSGLWYKHKDHQQWKIAVSTIFEKIIKQIVQLESPDIVYTISVPTNGINSGSFGQYDQSWLFQVGAKLQKYEEESGRFTTKFGMQAMPVWQTLQSFTSNQISYNNKEMLFHQLREQKFQKMRDYIDMYMRDSVDFHMEVYQSGLIQAKALKNAIISQRTQNSRSSGCMFWHLNDAWPGTTFSTIDYYGRWKPAQYVIKNYYNPIVAFFRTRTQSNRRRKELAVLAINDNLYPVMARIRVKVFTTQGQILLNKSRIVKINQTSQIEVMRILAKDLPNYQSIGKQRVGFYLDLIQSKESRMTSTFYLVQHKDLLLPKTPLSVKYSENENSFIVWSDMLIKDLYISLAGDQYVRLSDNYFDVVPHVPVTVLVINHKLTEIKDKLSFVSYRQSFIKGQKLIVNVV